MVISKLMMPIPTTAKGGIKATETATPGRVSFILGLTLAKAAAKPASVLFSRLTMMRFAGDRDHSSCAGLLRVRQGAEMSAICALTVSISSRIAPPPVSRYVRHRGTARRTPPNDDIDERGGSTMTARIGIDDVRPVSGDATYPALFDALLAWVTQGEKPTPASVSQRCDAGTARWGACAFDTGFTPKPLDTRVYPR